MIYQHSFSKGLIKIAVSARKAKKDVSIGYEMVTCFRNKRPLPRVIDRKDIEGATERRIARIVDHMTKFTSGERKNINEVEAEYQGGYIYFELRIRINVPSHSPTPRHRVSIPPCYFHTIFVRVIYRLVSAFRIKLT